MNLEGEVYSWARAAPQDVFDGPAAALQVLRGSHCCLLLGIRRAEVSRSSASSLETPAVIPALVNPALSMGGEG